MPAFYIREFLDNRYAKIEGDDFFHIKKSLRKKRGDELICFDKLNKYFCKIVKIEKKFILVEIIKKERIKERKKEINLFVGLINLPKFDEVVRYVSALNVTSLTPIVTEYTQQNLAISKNREKRWEKIIYEESKQSHNFQFLKIKNILKFENVLQMDGINILFHPSGGVYKKIDNNKRINLFIGPEGGFSNKEIKVAKRNNFYIMKLPFDTILRTEVAVITAIGFLKGKYGI